jgi:hypothetical protein
MTNDRLSNHGHRVLLGMDRNAMSRCIICDRGPPADDTIAWRLNEKGEAGLWVCTEHRSHFERVLKPTCEVIERAMEVKRKIFQ